MTGLLLPVWNKLPKGHVRVARLVDGEGRGLIGREIPAALLDEVGQNLGLDVTATIDPDTLAATVLETGRPMSFAGVDILTVRRAVVAGQRRIELIDWATARLDWYKAKGCIAEIISWRTRLFLPVGREASVLRTLARP